MVSSPIYFIFLFPSLFHVEELILFSDESRFFIIAFTQQVLRCDNVFLFYGTLVFFEV